MTVELAGRQETWWVDIDDAPKNPYSGNSYTIMIGEDEQTGTSSIEIYNPDKDGNVSGDEYDAVLDYFETRKGEK